MFDRFDEGYKKGIEDGRAGKERNLLSGMSIMTSLLSTKAVESYGKGYSIGYVKGKKEWQRDQQKNEIKKQKTTPQELTQQRERMYVKKKPQERVRRNVIHTRTPETNTTSHSESVESMNKLKQTERRYWGFERSI